MIVNETELNSRLNNPLNLINRLASQVNRKQNGMSLFMPPIPRKTGIISNIERVQAEPLPSVVIPISAKPLQEEPTTEELVKDSEDKIKLALAHDDALELLQDSIKSLRTKMDDVKPEKLPAVVTAASKVVESIRRERLERSRNNDNDNIHFHFYVPAQRSLNDYEIVNVTEAR